MLRRLVVLGVVVAPAAMAQQPAVVGTWHLSFVVGNKVEPTGVTRIQGSGTLTIEAKGDSLIATLVTDPIPERPSPPPVRMAAVTGPGEITFTSQSKATLTINGAGRETTATSVWKVRIVGDSLTGTVERQINGFGPANQGPQPISGSRQKA